MVKALAVAMVTARPSHASAEATVPDSDHESKRKRATNLPAKMNIPPAN